MNIKNNLNKYGPSILTSISILGTVATAILVHLADRKVFKDINPDDDDKDLKKRIKSNWKYYIPPAIAGLVTIGCSIGVNHWHLEKESALAAAAILYKDKLKNFGSSTENRDNDDEDKELVKTHEKNPFQTKNEKIKIWEPFSKQWFRASQQEILWAEIIINKMLAQNYEVTLNDLLKIYGCKTCKEGEYLGWSYDDDSFTELWACGGALLGNWIGFSPQIISNGDDYYFSMDYEIQPSDLRETRFYKDTH